MLKRHTAAQNFLSFLCQLVIDPNSINLFMNSYIHIDIKKANFRLFFF